jgi:hypothetical protein
MEEASRREKDALVSGMDISKLTGQFLVRKAVERFIIVLLIHSYNLAGRGNPALHLRRKKALD